MRCHICDAALAEVHYNSDHEDFEPCPHCLMVVEDTLAGFTDKPAAGEDELGSDDYSHLTGLADPQMRWRPEADDDFA